jgi:cysteine desulfurase / selenocysteine lyase
MSRLDDLRAQIPLLQRKVAGGKPLVYLDSAATSLTPSSVLDAERSYYEQSRANVHRGKHLLSEEASAQFEEAREKVAALIGASPAATVFTSGTTASINLVALGLRLQPNDVVVTTSAEHHAVLLPFYGRCDLRFVDVGKDGVLDPAMVGAAVSAARNEGKRVRLVAFAHASNVTGAIHDAATIARVVRDEVAEARILVDAAQSVAHLPLDVDAIGADYVAFSGHKMLGPTGIGVLAGKADSLDELSVELRGGGAVRLVDRTSFTSRSLPQKLEPGTPNIAGAIGLGAAASLLRSIGMDAITAHGASLAARLVEGVSDVGGVELIGPSRGAARLPLVSLAFKSRSVSPDHVAMILSDTYGVMVRSGHHCCHPYFDSLGFAGAVRASAGPYTTVDDVDAFLAAFANIARTLLK